MGSGRLLRPPNRPPIPPIPPLPRNPPPPLPLKPRPAEPIMTSGNTGGQVWIGISVSSSGTAEAPMAGHSAIVGGKVQLVSQIAKALKQNIANQRGHSKKALDKSTSNDVENSIIQPSTISPASSGPKSTLQGATHLVGLASAWESRPYLPSAQASSGPWVPWACRRPSWGNLVLPSEADPVAWLKPRPWPSHPAIAPPGEYLRPLRCWARACCRLP